MLSSGFAIYQVFLRGYISTVDLAVYRQAGYDLIHSIPLYTSQFGIRLNVRLGYVYPPIASVLFVPFALISMNLTKWIWTILSILELVVVARISFARFLGDQKNYKYSYLFLITSLVIWVSPMYNNLIYGQIDILVLTLILVDLVYLNENCRPKWLPEGILIGVAAAIKLVPALFFIYFLIIRDFKRLKNSVITFAGFTLIGFLIIPSDSKSYWLHYLENTGKNDNAWYFTNQSLDGMLRRFFPTNWFDIWVPLVVAMVIFGFITAYNANKRHQYFLAVILIGTLGVIISPISWIHECIWVIPIIGFILDDGKTFMRTAAAIGYYIFTTVELLQLGKHLIHHGFKIPGDILENSLGLSLILILFFLSKLSSFKNKTNTFKSVGTKAD